MSDHTQLNRRDAIKQLSAAAAFAAIGAPRRVLVHPEPALPIRPGVQLYTLRTEMEKNVEATLAKVAEIGYKEVEFAGYFGRTPSQIDRILKTTGLAAPSAHVGRDAIGAKWDKTLDDAAAAGHKFLVVASIPEADRKSIDTYKSFALELNKAAELSTKREITLAYHNHDFEFASLGGVTTGHETLLRNCDPELVKFELDLFWLQKAGRDPAMYIAEHPGRIALVHVKDMARDGSMTEVGTGTIDFQRAFDAGKRSIKHFFVEHDQPRVPFESITKSFVAMRRFQG